MRLVNGRPFRILCGDALETLRTLPAESVHCCVTSPPYWGLRDYGAAGQIGLEATPELFVARLVEVFREVRRVLRDDGTLWLNLGDSYATQPGKGSNVPQTKWGANSYPKSAAHRSVAFDGLKPKDLVGIPWRVAFALQADGWYLRSDIIWSKPNPMPESVTDRPTKAHEYLFLLSKSERYYYDSDAIKEPIAETTARDQRIGTERQRDYGQAAADFGTGTSASRRNAGNAFGDPSGRNRRSVWTIGTQPFPEAHFATFPPALVEPCIKAGTSEHGVCCECGAPWERVVGDKVPVEGRRAGNKQRSIADGGEGDRPADHLGRGVPWGPSVTPTVGWRPSCKCAGGGGNPLPAVVLDPFSGAGTTALVATRLRRRAIGIELNPEYVAMSERRIRGDAPLFHGAA